MNQEIRHSPSINVRIHHYGLATANLHRSAEVFRLLGCHVGEPIVDHTQQVEVCFVALESGCPIELVCDSGTGGPTRHIVSKMGSGLYHICYETDRMEEVIGILRERGFLLKQKPVAAAAFDGRRIAWLYNRDIGLIELLEK